MSNSLPSVISPGRSKRPHEVFHCFHRFRPRHSCLSQALWTQGIKYNPHSAGSIPYRASHRWASDSIPIAIRRSGSANSIYPDCSEPSLLGWPRPALRALRIDRSTFPVPSSLFASSARRWVDAFHLCNYVHAPRCAASARMGTRRAARSTDVRSKGLAQRP